MTESAQFSDQGTANASSDYARIAGAIQYIRDHAQAQPSLKEVADSVSLSEFHLQRLFTHWAGISPKRFLQSVTLEHAQRLLAQSADLLSASHEVGLSGSGRLHDLFVTIEAVTPGEFKSAGTGIEIVFGIHPTPFGECLIGQTDRGVCFLEFLAQGGPFGQLQRLFQRWPEARFKQDQGLTSRTIEQIFRQPQEERTSLNLLIKGTNFQMQVWRALLRIPMGAVTSYGDIARAIGKPRAVRAVGSAIGANPVAWLIPCHRVLRSNGELGGYHWGLTRKQACLVWESARAGAGGG